MSYIEAPTSVSLEPSIKVTSTSESGWMFRYQCTGSCASPNYLALLIGT